MMGQLPPIIAFAAPSGTGKTTLIEQVVRVMVGRGLRVGVLKADAHRVVLDTPGKDSWRFAEAGASPVAVLGADRLALFERLEGEVSIVSAAARLFPGVDVVLAEGFRRSGLPTIRVHRARGPADEGWSPPRNTVAWASDSAPETCLPVLPLDRPDRVADWIGEHFVVASVSRRPTVICPVADPGGWRRRSQLRSASAVDSAPRPWSWPGPVCGPRRGRGSRSSPMFGRALDCSARSSRRWRRRRLRMCSSWVRGIGECRSPC